MIGFAAWVVGAYILRGMLLLNWVAWRQELISTGSSSSKHTFVDLSHEQSTT